MKIVYKEMAQFYGVDERTISSYYKKLKEQEETGFIPYGGKHNIIRALELYYILQKNEEEDSTPLVEEIYHNIQYLNNYMFDLEKKEMMKEDYYTSLKQSLKKRLDVIVKFSEKLLFK